ncbi:hypothetical protein [Actinopolyspora alba]|nr:hypothetical protein [Actinopolyspora alba]
MAVIESIIGERVEPTSVATLPSGLTGPNGPGGPVVGADNVFEAVQEAP